MAAIAVVSAQPSIKKATHMAFYKWVAPSNDDVAKVETSSDDSAGKLLPSLPESSPNPESKKDDSEDLAESPEEAKRIQMYNAFVRQSKTRRGSRRRCANGPCRRGSNRLLRNLSAKLPNAIRLEDEQPREKEITVFDFLRDSRAPAPILMGRDRIRQNFCLTKTFTQTIQVRGCHPKRILNSFCYGQCNSFFIPTLSGSTNSPVQTCEGCKPQKTHTLKINLICPGRVEGIHTVHVEKVLTCSCNNQPQEKSFGA